MDVNKIHFIREIMVKDYHGRETPTMQISDDNASYLCPKFLRAPSTDQEQVRALYLKLGGGRSEGWESGSTVIIPNRSVWASLWPISAEEVQVMTSEGQVRIGNRGLGERVGASASQPLR
jgi:hypothetical protein